jgi:hypothetical protein
MPVKASGVRPDLPPDRRLGAKQAQIALQSHSTMTRPLQLLSKAPCPQWC